MDALFGSRIPIVSVTCHSVLISKRKARMPYNCSPLWIWLLSTTPWKLKPSKYTLSLFPCCTPEVELNWIHTLYGMLPKIFVSHRPNKGVPHQTCDKHLLYRLRIAYNIGTPELQDFQNIGQHYDGNYNKPHDFLKMTKLRRAPKYITNLQTHDRNMTTVLLQYFHICIFSYPYSFHLH